MMDIRLSDRRVGFLASVPFALVEVNVANRVPSNLSREAIDR